MNLKFDIETTASRKPGVYQKILDNIQPPANYKKADSIAKWIDENGAAAADEQYRKLALNGLTCEIVSIAWQIDGGEEQCFCGDNEGLILSTFFADIAKCIDDRKGDYSDVVWIGHNILDFDLRILYQRALVHGLRCPVAIPVDARHTDRRVFDTMRAWAGWKGYVKLDELCEAFGLEYPEDKGLTGADVHDLVRNEEWETIRAYNALDVRKVSDVFERMTA